MDQDQQHATLSGKPVDLQQLLKWSLALQALDDGGKSSEAVESIKNREPIDPKWIDIVLGKSDFVRMKESMEQLVKPSEPEDKRLRAADELELLIEDIDNANDFVKAKYATDLLPLLKDPDSKIRVQVLWILGTLCQNNPRVQKKFLEDGILSVILPCLNDSDCEVVGKVGYFLNSFLTLNREGLYVFRHVGGHEKVTAALRRFPLPSPSAVKFLHLWSKLDDNVTLDWLVKHLKPEDLLLHARSDVSDMCASAILRIAANLIRHSWVISSSERKAISEYARKCMKLHGDNFLSAEDQIALIG